MSQLVLLETLVFGPDGRRGCWRDVYWDTFRTTLVPWMARWDIDLLGTWQTPIGAGQSNEFTVLWDVGDGDVWNRWALAWGGLTEDDDLRRWRQVATRYVDRADRRLLRPSPGHDLTLLGRPAEPALFAGSSAEWVYELELTEFRPEGYEGRWRRDYWPEFRTRLVPTLARLGVELVGAWETSPGCGLADEHVFLYRVPSFAAWAGYLETVRRAAEDPVLRARREEMWVWREVWHTRLMVRAAGHDLSRLHREFE